MKIVIGCDHAGFPLKEEVKQKLIDAGHEVIDVGTHSSDSVDYPIYGRLSEEQLLTERLREESLFAALV